MSDRVTIFLDVNTQDANASIEEVEARADAVTKAWRLKRVEIIQSVRETISLISSMISTYQQFMSVIGAQVDPFFSALIGMTLSTISMMLSISASLALTGVGAYAAFIIGGIGIGLNLILMAKLIAEKEATDQTFSKIGRQIGALIGQGLSNMSPLGGF